MKTPYSLFICDA